MNVPTQYSPLQIRRKIEEITTEIHMLAMENQTLDWDIPSQYDRLLANVERMEMLTAWLKELERKILPRFRGDIFDQHAQAAVSSIFENAPPPSSLPSVTSLESVRKRRKTRKFEPITRGHLTLVFSKE